MIWRSCVFLSVVLCASLAPPAASQPLDPETPPAIPGMVLDFMEAFQGGLDDVGIWYCEVVDGTRWTYATEGENGYATCIGAHQNYVSRNTDMLTRRTNFSDFVVMWDMRFQNEGIDRAYRDFYFRATDDANPLGYVPEITVGWPPGDPLADNITFLAYGPGGWVYLTPGLECPWTLHQWYTFKLQALGNQLKLKVWPKGEIEPAAWFMETSDPDGTYSVGRIGFGNYWLAETDVDNIYVYVLGPSATEATTWGNIKALYAQP